MSNQTTTNGADGDHATSLSDLVRQAIHDGVTFRMQGAKVLADNVRLSNPEVMAQLRARRGELWDYLGGTAMDQPSLNLMAGRFPDIHLILPQNEAQALAGIAEIEADADRQTDAPLRGLVGLDIETMANPGEEIHQPIHIQRDGKAVRRPTLDPERLRRRHNPRSTAGLDPNRSTPRLVQLYGGGSACLVVDTTLVPLSVLAPVLGRRKLVIHNAMFELAFLLHAGIAVPRFECTMQSAGLLIGVHRRALEDVAEHYLDIELPKELQTSDWSAPVLSEGQYAYAALDAIIALKLWPLLRRGLIEQHCPGAYVLQRDAILPTVCLQRRGVVVDQPAHQVVRAQWALTLAEARRSLSERLGTQPPETPAEIRKLLERVLPADALKTWPRTTKSGELSTADKDLKRQDIPEIASVRAIKTQEKLLGSFGALLAAKVDADGRMRASFNLAGAKTGRMRCSAPNLQQMPRGEAFRNCFVAASGSMLVVGDFSMMELRAVAEIAGDTVMRQDFANGVDLHYALASQIHGIPISEVTKAQRQAAKPINFGTIYGAGAKGLAASAWAAYNTVLTVEEAQDARDHFLGRYRQVADWMRRNAETCQRRGYIEIGKWGRILRAEWEPLPEAPDIARAPTKGRRPVGEDYPNDGYDEDDNGDDDDNGFDLEARPSFLPPRRSNGYLKYTTCCNAPVQGACSEITMRAIVLVDYALTQTGIDGGLVLAVHDELVVEVPEARAEEAAKLLDESMTKAFAEYYPDAPIKKLVDTHIVRAWGEAK